jgi:hypothetical protein
MTPDEAIQLLAHAAAFDNRKPSAVAAKAWAAALHDVPLDEDALAAVARYYGLSTTTDDGPRWIQPHHVRAHRLALRDERGHVPGYLAALREQRTRAASGHSVPALAAGDSDPADNPAARKVREMFDAAQTEARRRKAEEARAASEALRLYRAAVEHVLALPDHGGDAMRWAREELLGDDQAAQGFPLLAQVPGVTDDHKVTIRAALATGMTESEAS